MHWLTPATFTNEATYRKTNEKVYPDPFKNINDPNDFWICFGNCSEQIWCNCPGVWVVSISGPENLAKCSFPAVTLCWLVPVLFPDFFWNFIWIFVKISAKMRKMETWRVFPKIQWKFLRKNGWGYSKNEYLPQILHFREVVQSSPTQQNTNLCVLRLRSNHCTVRDARYLEEMFRKPWQISPAVLWDRFHLQSRRTQRCQQWLSCRHVAVEQCSPMDNCRAFQFIQMNKTP